MSFTVPKDIIKKLSDDEIIWLFDQCSIIIFSLPISNIDKINDFFKSKKVNLNLKKKNGIQFGDDKEFIKEVFDEYSKRGYIVTGRHYDSINSYNY